MTWDQVVKSSRQRTTENQTHRQSSSSIPFDFQISRSSTPSPTTTSPTCPHNSRHGHRCAKRDQRPALREGHQFRRSRCVHARPREVAVRDTRREVYVRDPVPEVDPDSEPWRSGRAKRISPALENSPLRAFGSAPVRKEFYEFVLFLGPEC